MCFIIRRLFCPQDRRHELESRRAVYRVFLKKQKEYKLYLLGQIMRSQRSVSEKRIINYLQKEQSVQFKVLMGSNFSHSFSYSFSYSFSSPTSSEIPNDSPNDNPNDAPNDAPISLTYAEFSQQHKKKIKKIVEIFGVNQDVYKNLQYFTNCPWCFSMFTTALLPNLLQCGHFICEDCLKSEYSNRLKCAGKSKDKQCGRDILIKKKAFIQSLECIQYEKVNTCHINQCFDVTVADMKGKTVKLIGKPLKIKLSQLMRGHFQLTDQMNITINGKSQVYGQCSDKRLIDIGEGIIYRKISNQTNKIRIIKRTDGGRRRSVENL